MMMLARSHILHNPFITYSGRQMFGYIKVIIN